MHEFGITENIITNLLDELRDQHIAKVTCVHFRRSSAFSEEVLRQTFRVLSLGTVLEGAELAVDVAVLNVKCSGCGYSARVDSENLIGHMFICPQCATMREIAEAHDLELIDVTAEIGNASVS
jgi:Zn finger protein HypA/HybF involved in hydrogenase expression